MDELDKRIVRIMQEPFPLVAEPYRELAVKAGISEQELLDRLQRMKQEGKIRRIGAVLRHRKIGYRSNALCAWVVPAERLEAVAVAMSGHAAVSHCYDRSSAPNWPYTLYTMLHAHSQQECEAIAAGLAQENGLTDFVMLFTVREWKKTSMKYFCEGGCHSSE